MDTYEINRKKRKKAIKKYIHSEIKKADGSSRFCYLLTLILRILGIVLGVATVVYVICFGSYMVELLFVILTLGIPLALSFLPATVYIIKVGGEYRLRRRETVSFDEDYFTYSHRDGRTGLEDKIFAYRVMYDDINELKFNPKTKVLEITGKIYLDTYVNSVLKDSVEGRAFDFLDVYDIGVCKKIKEKMICI